MAFHLHTLPSFFYLLTPHSWIFIQNFIEGIESYLDRLYESTHEQVTKIAGDGIMVTIGETFGIVCFVLENIQRTHRGLPVWKASFASNDTNKTAAGYVKGYGITMHKNLD
jgi:hypothetical protein